MAILGSYIRKVAQEVAAKAGAQLQNFVKPKGSQKWTLCKLNASRDKATLPDGRQVNITFTGSPPAIAPCVQVSGNNYYVMGREDKIQTTDGGVTGLVMGQDPIARFLWIRRLGEGDSSGSETSAPVYILPLSTIQDVILPPLQPTNPLPSEDGNAQPQFALTKFSYDGNSIIFVRGYHRPVLDPFYGNPIVPYDYVLPDDGIACKDPASRDPISGFCDQCPENSSGRQSNYLEVRYVVLNNIIYDKATLRFSWESMTSGGSVFSDTVDSLVNQPEKPNFLNAPTAMTKNVNSSASQPLPVVNCLIGDFPNCDAHANNLGCSPTLRIGSSVTLFEDIPDDNINDFPFAFNYLGNIGYQYSDGVIRIAQELDGSTKIEVVGSFYVSKFSYKFRQPYSTEYDYFIEENCQLHPFFYTGSTCTYRGTWSESYHIVETTEYDDFNPGQLIYTQGTYPYAQTVFVNSPCNSTFWLGSGRVGTDRSLMTEYNCSSGIQGLAPLCGGSIYPCEGLRDKCVYLGLGGASWLSPYMPDDLYLATQPNISIFRMTGLYGGPSVGEYFPPSFGFIWECRDCAIATFASGWQTYFNSWYADGGYGGPKCSCYGGTQSIPYVSCCAGLPPGICPGNDDNIGECMWEKRNFGVWYLKNTSTVFGGFVFDVGTSSITYIKSEKLNIQKVNCSLYEVTEDNFYYGYGDADTNIPPAYGNCNLPENDPNAVRTVTGSAHATQDWCSWSQETLSNINSNVDVYYQVRFSWRGKSGGTASMVTLRSESDFIGSFTGHYVWQTPDFNKEQEFSYVYQDYTAGPYIFTDTVIWWDKPQEFTDYGAILAKAEDSYRFVTLARGDGFVFKIKEWTYDPLTSSIVSGQESVDTRSMSNVFDGEIVDFVLV